MAMEVNPPTFPAVSTAVRMLPEEQEAFPQWATLRAFRLAKS